MKPLVIDLPPELLAFVESSAIKATWKEPADFIRHLIQNAQAQWFATIERIAEEAIASGPATPWNPAELDPMRQKLREKYGAKSE